MRLIALLLLTTLLVGCGWNIRSIEISERCGDLSDGYYSAATSCWVQEERTVIISPTTGLNTPIIFWHELCHGWQGRNLADDDRMLDGWAATPEGQAFTPIYAAHGSRGAMLSPGNLLEAGAYVCGFFLLSPEVLAPDELAWAEEFIRW